MAWKLLRAPVIFFDSNPIGTILTRFSKDIAVTDFMPGIRIDLFAIVFVVCNCFVITLLTNYWDILNKNLMALTIQFGLELAYTLSFMIRMLGEVENLMTSGQRIMRYAELESEDELEKPNDPKNWPEAADIYFKNVFMRYRPHLPYVLKGLTYHVKDGEKVGIIGRTGAGKSSIMQTIFRLIEIEKESSIIIGGEDAKEIGLPQNPKTPKPHLFQFGRRIINNGQRST
jgi:ATP-binding cassette, subfamily C (CFTR/MRP), member 1